MTELKFSKRAVACVISTMGMFRLFNEAQFNDLQLMTEVVMVYSELNLYNMR